MKIADTFINITRNIRQQSNNTNQKIHIYKRPKLSSKKDSLSFNQTLIATGLTVLSDLRSFFKLEKGHAFKKNRALFKDTFHFRSGPRRLKLLIKLRNQLKSKER
jgi:hypothetical protein